MQMLEVKDWSEGKLNAAEDGSVRENNQSQGRMHAKSFEWMEARVAGAVYIYLSMPWISDTLNPFSKFPGYSPRSEKVVKMRNFTRSGKVI